MTPTARWPTWTREARSAEQRHRQRRRGSRRRRSSLPPRCQRDAGRNRKAAGKADRRTGGLECQQGQPGTRPRPGRGAAGNQRQPIGRRPGPPGSRRWNAPRTRPTSHAAEAETERARGSVGKRPRRRRRRPRQIPRRRSRRSRRARAAGSRRTRSAAPVRRSEGAGRSAASRRRRPVPAAGRCRDGAVRL